MLHASIRRVIEMKYLVAVLTLLFLINAQIVIAAPPPDPTLTDKCILTV